MFVVSLDCMLSVWVVCCQCVCCQSGLSVVSLGCLSVWVVSCSWVVSCQSGSSLISLVCLLSVWVVCCHSGLFVVILGVVIVLAFLTELIHSVVGRVYNFQPLLTRAEVCFLFIDHWHLSQLIRAKVFYL